MWRYDDVRTLRNMHTSASHDQEIHAAGMKAGVALNPATPISLLEDIIRDVDMILLMSVNPRLWGTEIHK